MCSISVVIPLYNKEETITRALKSVLKQKLEPREIIIVNDGSTDNSLKRLGSIVDNRIRIINQENKGVSGARNAGIIAARGQYIAFLDADDEWLPDYLSTIKELINLYPSAIVYGTRYYKKYDGDSLIVSKLKGLKFDTTSGIIENYFEVCNNSDPPLWTSAVTVAREELNCLNGFPDDIRAGEDLLTWARLSLKGEIAYSRTPCAIYYQPQFNPLLQPPDNIDFVGDELLKLKKNARNQEEEVELLRYLGNWHKMRAALYLITNQRQLAKRELIKSVTYSGLRIKTVIYFTLLLLPVKLRYTLLFNHGIFRFQRNLK